ncbi:right-handed parallel beta-helix repeat-containing protein [Geopsychrobacter electrodiphilus]|uniref:right-handed parallel beta-helix repeat-containing protein n=1 Tax=Geopsychrobacter electrodiphilus TaxID=225196 RepID=UPI000372590B|nr:right-handed parallel beta-helix repeat-containing protein [Geopsychrobacter electrodiphilus]
MRITVKLASLGLLLFFSAACALSPQGRPAPLTGVLSGDIRWQGTVLIGGDLVVEKTAQLVIAPSTEVVFLPPAPGQDLFTERPNFPGCELIVRGTLIAEGTAAAPIIFRYIDPVAPAGSWGGINLRESPEVRLRYVRITQANSAIHSHKSKAVIEESVVENNLFGLRFSTTEFVIRNNLLRNNGTAIRFHFGSPTIYNNVITDNEKGLFITSYPNNYQIEGNNIVGNRRYAVVLGEEVRDDVRMAGNYWGTDNPEVIAAALFDGREDDYLGKVLYAPFADAPVSTAGVPWAH